MTTTLLPNVEKLLSAFLRAQPSVIALVGDRVYTRLPEKTVFPAVQVHQFYTQFLNRPLWLARYFVQVDAWADNKAQAWNVSATVMAALGDSLEGVHADGIVNAVSFDGWTDDPDEIYTPAKPRWRFTALVTGHPLP